MKGSLLGSRWRGVKVHGIVNSLRGLFKVRTIGNIIHEHDEGSMNYNRKYVHFVPTL